jgi:Fe-S oxidoreductase
MVVLEPSCCSVFRDELKGLMPDSARARRLWESTFTLSEFMQKKVKDFQLPKMNRKAIVQGHCHHKAIMRLHDEEAVMNRIGLDFEVLESGCCGMAGAFGYEADKYEVSVKCGERALLPAVRRAGLSTMIIADGFSCREQISQQTNRHALHLAEVMQMAQQQPGSADGMYPEAKLVKRRTAGLRRARGRTLAALGLIALGATLLMKTTKRR